MRDDIRQALDIGPTATLAERTIDITTVGRRTGQDRRIEICFYHVGDSIYLTGVPGSRRRDWLINLETRPAFTFHLKSEVQADLPATARVISDLDERREILKPVIEAYNSRWTPNSRWPHGNLDQWVSNSPLAQVTFAEDRPSRQRPPPPATVECHDADQTARRQPIRNFLHNPSSATALSCRVERCRALMPR